MLQCRGGDRLEQVLHQGELRVDTDAGTAVVEPGIKLDVLNDSLRPSGWMVGPRPSTHVRCTFGGMIGNNSCGSHRAGVGKIVDSMRRWRC